MIYHYVILTVPHDRPNPTSYPSGRTLFGSGYRTAEQAQQIADRYNRFREAGMEFTYSVEPHDDLTEKVDCDHYRHC